MSELTSMARELAFRLSDYLAELTLALKIARSVKTAKRFRVWAEIPGKPVRELKTMKLILGDDQKVTLSISPVDAKGNPAAVDGAPAWSSSDDTILAVTAAPDGMSAVAVAGKIGDAQISVTADADMGGGTTTIAGALDVSVLAGQAVAFTINAGSPEAQ